MKRTIAISDIHGCITPLKAALKHLKYDPLNGDQLVLVGDYVDRGLRSKEVLNKVIELEKEGAIVLRGNHDDMMMKAFIFDDSGYDVDWINNGGLMTVESYVGMDWFTHSFDWEEYKEAKEFIKKFHSEHIEFLKTLKFFHETESHIFVHAGLNLLMENWKSTNTEDMIWIREPFFHNQTNLNKIVVFGHTPTLNLPESNREYGIWFDPINMDKIGIDGACAYGGQLNVLVYDEVTKNHEFLGFCPQGQLKN